MSSKEMLLKDACIVHAGNGFMCLFIVDRMMYMPAVGERIIQADVEMRPRDVDDFYETPEALVDAYLQQHNFPFGDVIIDPGCGTGVFGRALRRYYPKAYLIGIEQNATRFPNPGCYNAWIHSDYLHLHGVDGISADAVIGNPPYKLAEQFFWQSLHNINGDGYICFLLRLGFLESERRYRSMWTAGYQPSYVTVCSTRPSFTRNTKTYPTAFGFIAWHIVNGVCDQNTKVDFLTYKR